MARTFGEEEEVTVEGASGGGSAATADHGANGGEQLNQASGQNVLEEEGAVGGLGVSSVEPFWSPDQQDSTTQIPDLYQEDAATGQHLYLDFIRSEMARRGMHSEIECLEQGAAGDVGLSYGSIAQQLMWVRTGAELRQMADNFSQSRERRTVKQRAQSLQFESLDADHFFQLLQELFQILILIPFIITLLNMLVVLAGEEGMTRERVLVLFFFCADVAIEALRRGLHGTFHRLIKWSLKYIGTRVARYVHSAGGWGVVLRQSLDIAYQVTACCAFVAVVAACFVYIRRNLN